jgi:tetratricopeptide (TPR) repeat protein
LQLAGALSYSRDQEREADRIGALLMHEAGYDVAEAGKVWENLLLEIKARDGKDPGRTSPLFATHPPAPERRATLKELATTLPGGTSAAERYADNIQRFLPEWLQDELKRAQYDESLVLLSRHIDRGAALGSMHLTRGEVYRARNGTGDQEPALEDFRVAAAQNPAPAEAYRGIGLVSRQRGERKPAAEALARYLEMAPQAPDAAFIQSYISELTQ